MGQFLIFNSGKYKLLLRPDKMKIIFIGGGISTISLLCYFIREENKWFQAHDWLILEKREQIGIGERIGIGDLGNYKIRSNSVLPAFRSIIPTGIRLDPLLKTLLVNVGDDFAPLGLVSEMMAGVAQSILKQYSNVIAKTNSAVLAIENNVVILENERIESDCIVIATGASQEIPTEYLHCRNVLTSTDVLSNSHDFTNKRIAIVGASHSAWSVVWTFLQDYRKPFGVIDIYSRNKTRVFFRSTTAATLDFYDYNDDDICSETNQIHRFGGLRGDSKQVWRNHRNGLYPNINHFIAKTIPCDLSSNYDYVIIAYNYKRREIPGGENCLNFGFMSNIPLETGEKSFNGSKDGIWLYSNILAKIISKQIMNKV
jgi:hypothetical protein